jgi:hypothetical protein
MFLVIGILIVIAAGQLLAMSGRRHLGPTSGSAALLVSVLFHVVTLGVVALLTAVPVGGGVDGGLMLRLGFLLLALAVVFGITMTLLVRRRGEAPR